MRMRIERGEGKTWFLTISGGSNRPITRRSLIRQTIVMVVLDIATILLITAALIREIQAGDNTLLLLLTLFPLVAAAPGQFYWWRNTGQALREHDEDESE